MADLIFLLLLLLSSTAHSQDGGGVGWNWEMWWTYDGISGPEFWGVINPAWGMCSDGRRQSPINLDPRTILHDPNLTPLTMDKHKVSGRLQNTGHGLEWWVVEPEGRIHMSGGPLSYSYALSHLRLHFGERDAQGSEHTIANHAFPAEVQVYGYNDVLYGNFSQAATQVHGVVAIAVLIQLGDRTSPALESFLKGMKEVQHGGSSTIVNHLSPHELVSSTSQYLTYEGSLTEPGCHETVTWIIPNKPLYVSFTQMRLLRGMRQGSEHPQKHAPLSNNFRPIQSAHHRTVRTNIEHQAKAKGKKCTGVDSGFHYKANSRGWNS